MIILRLLLLSCTLVYAATAAAGSFNKVAQTAAVACRQQSIARFAHKQVAYTFGDLSQIQHALELAYASKENIRGADGKPAYATQDRIAGGCLKGNFFVGLFDGHGKDGDKVATLLQKELVRRVLLSKQPGQSLKQALAEMQDMLKNTQDAQHAGSTAVVSVLDENNLLTVAHVGDSRLLVVRNGKELFSTRDHKPTDELEAARIEKNGGFVTGGRVWNKQGTVGFALARSMGDIQAQGTALIATPDITSVQLTKGDTVVVASDGVWDVLSNEQVIKLLQEGGTYQEIADRIVEEARAEKSADDITAVVFKIK